MKRKGFTLVELLVVITIIALLMSILMPALGKIKQLAYRVMCGTNLSAIGKQIVMYASYNDETYPVAGNKKGVWSTQGGLNATGGDWEATEGHKHAYGGFEDRPVTITSSLFLLIKYADASPKQFMCRGDAGVEVFTPDFGTSQEDLEIEDAWDFGAKDTGLYCSYTYHMPYWFPDPGGGTGDVSFAINPMSHSSCPLSSDRNLYLDKNADVYLDNPKLRPPRWLEDAYSDEKGLGNCAAHQRDGQNVLFNDTSVRFEDQPNVGVDSDNIYKYWGRLQPSDETKQLGKSENHYACAPTKAGDTEAVPWSEEDALLVGEENKEN